MDEILQKLENIERRLSSLESRVSGPSQAVRPAVPPPPPPPMYKSALDAVVGREPLYQGKMQDKKQTSQNFESTIGKWWFGVIGVVAILFGVAFFLKYAFDNDLISETMRVILGLAGGLGLLLLGEFLRPRLAKYSYLLSGGGLALFYLSVYGAFQYYHLIGQSTAFVAMIAITFFGVALALWADAAELSLLSAAGGFLTPFLVSTGTANDLSFFSYLVLLNLGIVAVAFFKKWHPLVILGFVATILNFASWYGGYYEHEKLFFTIYILTIFYLIYLVAGLASNIVARKLADLGDLFVLSINPAWYFGWLYFLLYPQYEHSLGFVAAGLGAVYIFSAYLASATRADDRRLTLFLGGIAVVLLTIAIPLEVDGSAITIAWSVEAAVLFILGLMLRNEGMRIFAIGVYLVAVVRLFTFDSDAGALANYLIIFNKRFFTYFVLIVSATLMGYAARQKRDVFTSFERGDRVPALFWGAANVLVFILIILEIYAFYDARIYTLQQKIQKDIERHTPAEVLENQAPYAYYETPAYQAQNRLYADAEYRRLNNYRNATISVFLTLYAIVLMAAGVMYRSKWLRWSAVALFAITIGKVFFYDLTVLATPQRIVSFIVLGVILLCASYLYFRFEKRFEEKIAI